MLYDVLMAQPPTKKFSTMSWNISKATVAGLRVKENLRLFTRIFLVELERIGTLYIYIYTYMSASGDTWEYCSHCFLLKEDAPFDLLEYPFYELKKTIW